MFYKTFQLLMSLLFVIFFSLPSIHSVAASNMCSKALTTVLAAGVLNMPLVATEYHFVNQFSHKDQHLGHGIYFDRQRVISILTPYEKSLVLKASENERQVAELFTQRLKGEYNFSYFVMTTQGLLGFLDYIYRPAPASEITVSEMLEPKEESLAANKGVCAHKVITLHHLLKEFGIDHKIESGYTEFQIHGQRQVGSHVWISLPKYNLVLDPVATDLSFGQSKQVVFSREVYHQGYANVQEVPASEITARSWWLRLVMWGRR